MKCFRGRFLSNKHEKYHFKRILKNKPLKIKNMIGLRGGKFKLCV